MLLSGITNCRSSLLGIVPHPEIWNPNSRFLVNHLRYALLSWLLVLKLYWGQVTQGRVGWSANGRLFQKGSFLRKFEILGMEL
jgi:hypothetical protein